MFSDKELNPKIPYGAQDISQADIDAVNEVLRSEFLTQGPVVPRFELSVASMCDAQYAVAVNSATSALHLACLALGVEPGDSVWTTPTTFVATANCAIYCGANIDFVDIDPLTYNMSTECLREKLMQSKLRGKLPKVVIAVHLCGQSCDMEAIYLLAKEYGFCVIEDASHAIGGQYKKHAIGSCMFSDITVFSFHPVKIITTGEGGMAVTNRPELAERMRLLRSHGVTNDIFKMSPRREGQIWNYQQIDLGYNYRLTDIQAALGLSQMKRLDEFLAKRRAIAKKYNERLSNFKITIPWQHSDAISSYHLYPVRIKESLCGRTQKEVYEIFHKNNVCVNLHYIPIYLHPYYEAKGFKEGYCPESELYFQEAITLPIYPTMSAASFERIISVLEDCIN